MQRNRKAIVGVVIAVIVVIAGVTVSLTHGLGNGSSGKSGNTLIIADSAQPASLDPATAYSTAATLFTDNFYNTLVGYGTQKVNGQTVGSLNPVPELATSWTTTANPNGTETITFHLRHNVTFQNGDPFNASDVKFTLDRVITMHQGPSFHVRQYLNKTGIQIINKYTVNITSSQAYPWFLNLFQLWVTGIVDPAFVNAHGGVQANNESKYMNNHEMGTGAYILSSYTSSKIVLSANKNYWAGSPNITRIVYEVVSSAETQQSLLAKGSVNMAMNIPFNQVGGVAKNNTNVKLSVSPTSSEWYIGLNENMTPFHNLSMRKAVNYAVNASNIVKHSTFGYGVQLQSVIAPSIEAYNKSAWLQYEQNLTLANQYYQQAMPYLQNHDQGNLSKSGVLTVNFYYESNNPVDSEIATILQAQLKNVNISLNLKPTTSNVFQTDIGHGHYAMFFEGWINLLATPDDGMFALFNGANSGLGGNYNFFNNTTVNHDLVNASTTYNKKLRDQNYTQIQNILASQAVEIPLFNQENVIPVTTNVHGPVAYPTFDFFFYNDTMT